MARIKDLTNELGAHSVIEAVGTQESTRSTREGGHVGYVGVSHDVALPRDEMFRSHVHLHGGPAPIRRFMPELIKVLLRPDQTSTTSRATAAGSAGQS